MPRGVIDKLETIKIEKTQEVGMGVAVCRDMLLKNLQETPTVVQSGQ